MDRRRFLELTGGGIAGACLPASTLHPSQEDLIRRAMSIDEKAISSLMSLCGYAVGADEPLEARRLEIPLAHYEQTIDVYREARGYGQEDALVFELLAAVEMEAAAIEALLGRDPRKHLDAAIAAVWDWQRISPYDPLPAAVLAHNSDRAKRIIASRTQFTPSMLLPRDILRWGKSVA